MNDIDKQLTRYQSRRAACTLPDGTRPLAWWKRWQKSLSIPGELSAAEIKRDAAKVAKLNEEVSE